MRNGELTALQRQALAFRDRAQAQGLALSGFGPWEFVMSALLVSFVGRFQIWSYAVSHGELLVRSTKSGVRATQVDMLFSNVVHINLPAGFDDLTLRGERVRRR